MKTIGFAKPKYIGDPINAVRIFNDLAADELVFLDIDATRERRRITADFVRKVGEEANMPFAVGGGIRSIADIREVLAAGAEKVVIGSHAVEDPSFVAEAARTFGSSTIVVCIDVKSSFFGGARVATVNATKSSGHAPEDFARSMQERGAGELIVQSVDRDGAMAGYDLELVRKVASAVTVPVVALGGAGKLDDLRRAHVEAHATGLAAGSLFVYQGPKRGVLINYPERSELPF